MSRAWLDPGAGPGLDWHPRRRGGGGGGGGAAPVSMEVCYQLPVLPLDRPVPQHVLSRRGAISFSSSSALFGCPNPRQLSQVRAPRSFPRGGGGKRPSGEILKGGAEKNARNIRVGLRGGKRDGFEKKSKIPKSLGACNVQRFRVLQHCSVRREGTKAGGRKIRPDSVQQRRVSVSGAGRQAGKARNRRKTHPSTA